MTDWMMDHLTSVVPSSGAGVDKRDTIWSQYMSISVDPILKDMVRALDEDFSDAKNSGRMISLSMLSL